MNTEHRTQIWEEYFEKLLNIEEAKELIEIGNVEINLKQNNLIWKM